MAHDARRGRTVLFGGSSSTGGVVGDTWEWSGSEWERRTTPNGPGVRSYGALAYDSARGACVLFGGGGGVGVDQTWTYDGSDWRLETPARSPVIRANPTMAFDAARSRTVMTGGARFADTWTWDGAEWSRAVAPAAPPATGFRLVAYDAPRRRAVSIELPSGLFSGPMEPWEWDGDTWSPVPVGSGPRGRYQAAAVFDSARSRTLIFGGIDTSQFAVDETWEWDGATWRDRTAPGSPSPRSATALADDAGRGRVILFGGEDCAFQTCAVFADTWEWDGTAWTRATPATSPPGRARHAMAYDAARGRTVLFGGYDAFSGELGDTWEFDGSTWALATPATSPSPRSLHAMAYDAARGRVVLFGGVMSEATGQVALSDTWEWDGVDWTPIATPSSPPPSVAPGATYDPICGRVLLLTRGLCQSSTWTLEGPLALASVGPPSGSAAGGDLVTVFGTGYTDPATSSVFFGGVDATVESAGCGRLRARTPALPLGPADVTVVSSTGSATLPAAYVAVEPDLAARFGNVDVGNGNRVDVLLVNGSAGDARREIVVASGGALRVTVGAPPATVPAPFAAYVWAGEATPATLAPQPLGLGVAVFPTPFSGGLPQPRRVANNAGAPNALGFPNFPSAPAPSTLFDGAAPRPFVATLQAIIADQGSQARRDASLTNAVIVRVVR
jgi:hypothetical protein